MWGLTNAQNDDHRFMPPTSPPVPAARNPEPLAIPEPTKAEAPALVYIVPLDVAQQVLTEAIAAHERTGRAVEVARVAVAVAQSQG